MRLVAVLVSSIAVLSFVTSVPRVTALLADSPASRRLATSPVEALSPSTRERHPTPIDPDREDVLFDVDGHEILRAVAKYGVGQLGSLYELHSPRTEVTKLGSPSS